ncbi:cupin domain-containing protein [Nocardia terpenica]|uniref:Cupin n=1 Tax=Nocardia terpenica TaxID=455432 RepID=A0A291RH03_9NOCA|nr:cupin domain-containing protein [Nocardia terpenica]ATL66588.1 cupin [Nocardia terpenica]
MRAELDTTLTEDGPRKGVVHVPAGAGPSICVAGDTYTVKASTEMTGGALAFLEASVPPSAGPAPHIHTLEDEAYYLLHGKLEILDTDRTFVAKPGDFVFIPKGTTHRFKNRGTQTAKMIFLFTPAGFDRFFMEIGKTPQPGAPAPEWTEEDYRRVAEVGRRYGRLPGETAGADDPAQA